ncbi:putative bifunctional transcriptional activator/DNA repair enzyme AlkA [Alphaproteobacteria bacterium SO-S41]|nr:putative bifunctional transcriptional activator/DNA repair enzyme AlkA [Alphaproteobacteria bacterium SO-S41]
MDPTLCYRALKSRDARFDGRFFTCVKTTGIYCRPVCPARLPLFKNVVFVASAAAAQKAGFRPCLRCRPECAPGAPAWRGTGAVAARALKLIAEGALDDAGVDALAERTGLGARHLRRLIKAHAGASPVQIARARRILFAKRLIAETPLKLTDIAYASGFRSLRRFNAEMAAALGRAPRALRKDGPKTAPGAALILPLTYRPPYDWDGVLAFLRLRAVPGVEVVTDISYARHFALGAARGRFTITHDAARRSLIADIEIDKLEYLDRLVSRIRALFDLDADPEAIAAAFAADDLIAPRLAVAPGLRLVQSFDAFEAGLRAIAGQQVTVKGAITLLGRLAARCAGDAVPLVMPEPDAILAADLSGLGLTGARIVTLQTWARFARQPGVLDALRFDPDAAIAQLTGLPGFGPWTAQYLALRGLGDTDAFPAGDLGLRQNSGLEAKDLQARAEAWRPFRAYAAQALWRVTAITDVKTPARPKPAARVKIEEHVSL